MKKQTATWLVLLLTVIILVVLNMIFSLPGPLNFRLDLTEKRVFTLSDGTRNIIHGLNPDRPVAIRLYISKDSRIMPQFVQSYAATVENLLLEIEKESGGKITLERIDPRPKTEEEDRAMQDDIQGHQVNPEGDKIYFGLAIESPPYKEIIPFLNPHEEVTLEYQLARALSMVGKPKDERKLASAQEKPGENKGDTRQRSVVGVLSSMPITGPDYDIPQGIRNNRMRPPWFIIRQLRQNYEVREIRAGIDAISQEIDVLLVIHPADLPSHMEYAIDQYLLKGGKVIAYVDPQALVSNQYNTQGSLGGSPTISISAASDLPNLFKAWGVAYKPSEVVADNDFRVQGAFMGWPTYLTVPKKAINDQSAMTAQLDVLGFFSAGVFDILPHPGIHAETLVRSSPNTKLISPATVEEARNTNIRSFRGDNIERVLGVRLTGRFSTAFPDGRPKTESAPASPTLPGGLQLPGGMQLPGGLTLPDTGGAKEDAGAPAKEGQKDQAGTPTEPTTLQESVDEKGAVVLFSDVDMLFDAFCLQTDERGNVMGFYNQNIPLLLNAIDSMVGGADLLAVRSRGSTQRPFTRMNELIAEVGSAYHGQIQEKEAALNDILAQVAKLGGTKDSSGVVRLNVNQDQYASLMRKQGDVEKSIRELQKAQNREKDKLEMTITLINILSVPALITLFGIALALRRRSVQAAR